MEGVSNAKKLAAVVTQWARPAIGQIASANAARLPLLANMEKALRWIDKEGREQKGAHWTAEEVEKATVNRRFAEGVTLWDKYVGYNAMWADLNSEMSDEEILTVAYLFYFADKDWKSEGTKVWEYMCLANS